MFVSVRVSLSAVTFSLVFDFFSCYTLQHVATFCPGICSAVMSIEEELQAFKTRLDPKIGAYFDTAIERIAQEDALVAEALRYCRVLVLAGGKRLRAAFMYYGYMAARGIHEEKMLTASMSIEFIHAFLLVHDDIIDRDNMRHGTTTLHRKYADLGRRYFPAKDTDHFGNSIALILGDMLGAFGNDIIFSAEFPVEHKFQALSKLQDIVSYTVIGQARDIYMEYEGKAREKEILAMYRNKTAKYTVEGPLHLGAILGGASHALLDGLSAYAIPLGIAFQIQDDILGIYGKSERLGKPVGSDIEEGKITLLVSRALRDGTREEQARVRTILGRGMALTAEERWEFQDLLEKTGARAGTEALAATFIDEGINALQAIRPLVAPRAFEFLSGVAAYMLKREY